MVDQARVVLAFSAEEAMRWVRDQGAGPYDYIVVKGRHTLEGLRFRYEDVVRLPGWSRRSDIEELEEIILRTHVTMQPRLHFDVKDGIDWDIDANQPTYTKDFLRLIDEGKIDDVCTYGTALH